MAMYVTWTTASPTITHHTNRTGSDRRLVGLGPVSGSGPAVGGVDVLRTIWPRYRLASHEGWRQMVSEC